MKRFLITFVAVLAAIIVGLIGNEWYWRAELQEQGLGPAGAAYLSQGMVLASTIKSATDSAWVMSGEVPCSAGDYEAAGFSLPRRNSNDLTPWVEVTGCGELSLIFAGFDGTPPGRIEIQATPDPDAFGTYFSWSCTSPSYETIGEYFSWCRYVESEMPDIPDAPAVDSTTLPENKPAEDDSCGLEAVIYRSAFTEAVDDRTPVNRIAAIGPGREEVFFFTEIIGASGKRVSHEWFHNGMPISSKPFDVEADRWRTWSSKRIAEFGPGTLHVEVRDDRCLIGQESIKVLDKEPDQPSLSGFMSPYKAIEAVLANYGEGNFNSVVTMTPVGELYRFDDGDTPLQRAIRTGNRRAVVALLDDAKFKHENDISRGLQILYDYDAAGRQAQDIARDMNNSWMISKIEPMHARFYPEWAVSRATFTTAMGDGEPLDCRDEAYDDESSMTFFAELTDMAGRQVTHEWVFDDRVVQANAFSIGSDRWSTQSTRHFSPEDVGRWRVRVTAANGDVLHSKNLRYDELNDINKSRRETYRRFACNIGGGTLQALAMGYAPIARFEYLLQRDVLLKPWIEKLTVMAVEGRNISLLRWLLTKDLALDDVIGNGHTPLTLAAEVGDANMVLFLLRQGADINQQNRRARFGPLEFATLNGNSLVTRILLEHGADPNGTNSDRVGALGRAVHACDSESVRLLLEYGADPRLVDNRGDRPIDRAKSCLDRGVWTAETPEWMLLQRASTN